jgi:acetyltransferase-like isoleucine patch superfamily enzyme
VIVNHNASVDHDCILEDGVHVAPGACLGGGATVGSRCLIGLHAAVLPKVSIGSGTVVGAGAVVLHDTPPNAVTHGVPAHWRPRPLLPLGSNGLVKRSTVAG